MPARRKHSTSDLSIRELRQLLLEKHKGIHAQRLAHYQQNGRVIPQTTPESGNDPAPQEGQPAEATTIRTRRKPRAKWMDTTLLLVEIAAVVGLVVVFIYGFSLIRNLNIEAGLALAQQPTPAATPLVQAVVLPGGHTPPNSENGTQPNTGEIPAHLLPAVQSLLNVPIPTASPEQAIRLQVPAIKVDAPVVQGDGWEQLRKGIGQYINAAVPGRAGNVVLSAHNDVFGEIFRQLDQLAPGDSIIVYTSTGQYTYLVQETLIVEPTRVEVMAPTSDATLTLISCYPYMIDNKRIVVKAILND